MRWTWWLLAGGALLLFARRSVVDRLTEAIGQVESSGRYDVLGPPLSGGRRAYGKYQVLNTNIPTWTREALGRAMTPGEFLNDPRAQDATARHRVAAYYAAYGTVADVASLWLTGNPIARAGAVSDVLGTNAAEYVRRVTEAMA